MTIIIIILTVIAGHLNSIHPNSDFNVYCDRNNTVCQIEDDSLGTDEAYTVLRLYPYECVNGEWMQVNRSGYPSGSENVFDVGPWNPPTTTFGGCGSTPHYYRW